MTPARTDEQLVQLANVLWDLRWNFRTDANGDGAITISDAWLWVKWVFFAPGDLALLLLMKEVPSLGNFLELSVSSLGGVGSFILSAFVWLTLVGALRERQ